MRPLAFWSAALVFFTTTIGPAWGGDRKKPCEGLLVKEDRSSQGGDKKGVASKVDGVYNAQTVERYKHVESQAGPDENVFNLVQQRLNNPQHIIDWGAGSGRMLKFYRQSDPKWTTLVEPSSEFIEILKSKAERIRNEEIIQGKLGDRVARFAPPELTVHTAIFVINCIESAKQGLNDLWNSMLPGERALVATNVFVPRAIAESVHQARGNFVAITLGNLHIADGARPISKTFTNEIIGKGVVLNDSVQTIDEVESWIENQRESIAMGNNGFLSPVGFRLTKKAGDNFGDYDFVVLWLEFQKLK